MGFDASLGFVINLGAPQSPVAYYQQVGRAGRGTDRGQRRAAAAARGPRHLGLLRLAGVPARGAGPADHRRARRLRPARCPPRPSRPTSSSAATASRRCSRCSTSTAPSAACRAAGWRPVAPWVYDAERYARVRAAREREQAAMLAYLDSDVCRMRYLREQLDDPDAVDCGRCDNCGGLSLATDGVRRGRRAASAAARPAPAWPSSRARCGPPRWPTWASASRARSASGPAEGRAIARLTDLGHGQALRELFGEGAPDGPVPPPLAPGLMTVMKDWSGEWAERPVAIVHRRVGDPAPAGRRPRGRPVPGHAAPRRRHLGDRRPLGRPRSGRHQLRAARRRRTPALRAARRRARRAAVLLVDDLVVTGWTLTVAAVALREAGASAVLPARAGTQA